MLASTLLISCGPKPVTVRLCFGREMPGGPNSFSSEIGAAELAFLSLGVLEVVVVAIFAEFNGKAEASRAGEVTSTKVRYFAGELFQRSTAGKGKFAHAIMTKLLTDWVASY